MLTAWEGPKCQCSMRNVLSSFYCKLLYYIIHIQHNLFLCIQKSPEVNIVHLHLYISDSNQSFTTLVPREVI